MNFIEKKINWWKGKLGTREFRKNKKIAQKQGNMKKGNWPKKIVLFKETYIDFTKSLNLNEDQVLSFLVLCLDYYFMFLQHMFFKALFAAAS